MRINKKSKYSYIGPVRLFNDIVNPRWEGVTWAPSNAKALANLAYRYKTEHGYGPGSRILLNPDCLFAVTSLNDDYEYYDEEWRKIINESV